MSVVSFEFLGFLAALAVVYYVLPMRVRKWALLAGSAAFWLLCGWQGAAYLTAETLLIWGCARLIGRFSERRGVCRALLIGGMVTVFGAMVLMKALSQLQALPDGLLVPIGLSYFTFQSVGYLVDVYRGKVTPEKNYAKVLLFAGFFPQMTQGPITTWKQLMPQLDSPHRLSPNGFVSGVFLMAWGFFKKLVIADRLMPVVSVLVAAAQELPGWLVLATAAMYAIVLYADFSGGIDIIRGAAELLGIDLPENFRRPFFAASIADYWRRWHISLGVWFRTYLLYPLVASRAGIGLAKVGKRLFGAKAGRAMPGAAASEPSWDPKESKLSCWGGAALMKAFGWLRTMAAVLLAQFFACTTSPGMAFGMMGRIFTDFGAGMTRNFPLGMQDGAVAIIAVLLMLLVDILCEKQPDLRKKLAVSPLYVRWTLLMGLIFLTLIFGCYGAGFDRAAFLYAGF